MAISGYPQLLLCSSWNSWFTTAILSRPQPSSAHHGCPDLMKAALGSPRQLWSHHCNPWLKTAALGHHGHCAFSKTSLSSHSKQWGHRGHFRLTRPYWDIKGSLWALHGYPEFTTITVGSPRPPWPHWSSIMTRYHVGFPPSPLPREQLRPLITLENLWQSTITMDSRWKTVDWTKSPQYAHHNNLVNN